MLNSNENRSSSPELILPTDITSDQAEAINKNSIELETEQPLQGSLAGSRASLVSDDIYVDSREESPNDMKELLDRHHPTSSSTPSGPVSKEINGTIQIIDNKVELTIGENDLEKFRKYKNIDGDNNVIDREFFASFTLNDKRIHITGLYPQGEQTNNSIVTVCASSIASNGTCHFECDNNGTYDSPQLQEIKDLLGLSENEVKVNISKHFVKELKDEINALEAQLSNRPDAAQLKDKDEKIKDLEAEINQPNAEVEKLKNDLKTKTSRVHQLEKENKELEAKNKTTEQPKQGNGARYTATVGMGLAAGLIAFTALERTVRLDMLVMIGIAVTSALVAGGITYAALPSTQVDGAKAQEVDGNNKGK